MHILSLAGWGQPETNLHIPGLDITPLTYLEQGGVQQAVQHIGKRAKDCDAIIGWSLGGQLAAMAISAGLAKPKKLVMIASPFQFVKSDILPLGMPRPQYNLFCDNYAANPKRTLSKAWELVIKDDKHESDLRRKYLREGRENVLKQNWLAWLHHLDDLSCHGLPFAHFPPTLLLHGDRDAVVYMNQSEHYVKHLPQARLEVFAECGHAPHWHDPSRSAKVIKEFLGV